MGRFKIQIKPYSSNALLIQWPTLISKEIIEDISFFEKIIRNKFIKHIIDVNFVYSSLLIIYNDYDIDFLDFKNELEFLYSTFQIEKIESKNWKIPVCYDEDFGVDLAFISETKKLSVEQIITLHTSHIYTVYGIGFLPGFLYLGELPQGLIIPRRSIPRSLVEKGSVAIAENQTGIYPQNSPGGWHIVGKTAIKLFDASKSTPLVIAANDTLQFYQISKDEFLRLSNSETDMYEFLI